MPNELTRFRAVLLLFEEVFKVPHGANMADGYLQKLLENPTFIVMDALLEGECVGGLSAYVMSNYFSERPFIYLFDLAVKESVQRQGIGTNLVQTLKDRGRRLYSSEVFVQADLADAHALNFYKKIGGIPESVVHYTFDLEKE